MYFAKVGTKLYLVSIRPCLLQSQLKVDIKYLEGYDCAETFNVLDLSTAVFSALEH